MNEFTIETTRNTFPYIDEVKIDGRTILYQIDGPHRNCQTRSICPAEDLLKYNDKDIIEIFKLMFSKCKKPQVLIDINEEKSLYILKKMKIVSNRISIKRYISTNGSKMMYCLCTIDVGKIKSMNNE